MEVKRATREMAVLTDPLTDLPPPHTLKLTCEGLEEALTPPPPQKTGLLFC